jgi:Domain of unknown function (DUF6438)
MRTFRRSRRRVAPAALAAVALMAAPMARASAQSSPGGNDTSFVLGFRPRTQAPFRPSGANDSSYVIALERSNCLGTCPAYVVTLNGKGYERFTYLGRAASDGDDRLRAGDVRHFRIASGTIARLRRWVDSLGFFEIAEDWTQRGPNCRKASTDEATATITVIDHGRRHVVRHYDGCAAAPAVLSLIETRIDSTAQVWRWFDTNR